MIKHVSIHVDHGMIGLDGGLCFMCGEPFEKGSGTRTKNHAIPVMFNPKGNVTFPMHRKCHQLLNSAYRGDLHTFLQHLRGQYQPKKESKVEETFTCFDCDKKIKSIGFPYTKGWKYLYGFKFKKEQSIVPPDLIDKHFCSTNCLIRSMRKVMK